MWPYYSSTILFSIFQGHVFHIRKQYFYSEIPLPFPNSSYLLEPSNPMANVEMRF